MTTATVSDVPANAAISVADLLLGISNGDRTAWDEILRRYSKLVFATVRSFRLQEADTLDAVQATWLRLVENAHRVQSPEYLSGWLVTTSRRECLRVLRQSKVGPDHFDTADERYVDPSAGPEQRAVDADTIRILWNLVGELSSRRRTILRALFNEHPRSYAKVARISGIPAGGIGPTRSRALAQLRDKVERHGLRPGMLSANPGTHMIVVGRAAENSRSLRAGPPVRC